MKEIEQRWRELKAEIKCPLKLKPESCKKDEGIKRNEKFLSHSAVVLTTECNFCGEQASG